jgi:aminomethyltransferase
MDKPWFVGRAALERLSRLERDRELVAYTFPGADAPPDGAQVLVDGVRVGNLTSSRYSPVLEHGIALGYVKRTSAGVPTTIISEGSGRRYQGTRTHGPFYDPEGVRLRA